MKYYNILLIDDEQNVLNALRRLLRKEPYNLFSTNEIKEAFNILESQNIQLVISDERMPVMSGTTFLQTVKERWPETIRVILSGYADVAVIVESINKGSIFRFLPKPWDDEEMKSNIRQCLNQYDLLQQREELLQQVQDQNISLLKLNSNLEKMVSSRTKSLAFAQEILEKFPIPVMGVDAISMLTLKNDAVDKNIPELKLLNPGLSIYNFFPENIQNYFAQIFFEKKRIFKESIEIFGRNHVLTIEPLLNLDDVRGFIIILETTT